MDYRIETYYGRQSIAMPASSAAAHSRADVLRDMELMFTAIHWVDWVWVDDEAGEIVVYEKDKQTRPLADVRLSVETVFGEAVDLATHRRSLPQGRPSPLRVSKRRK